MPQERRSRFLSPTPAPTPTPTGIRRSRFLSTQTETDPGSLDAIIRSVSPTAADAVQSVGETIAPYAQPVLSKLSPVLDVLSRGQYASAKFFDSLMDDSKDVFDAAAESFNELLPEAVSYGKQEKLSFSDVLKRRAPDFAKNNPTTTTILGFVGDVALDPTTYLGAGLAKTGTKIGGQVLTKTGEKVLKEGIEKTAKKAFVGKDGTLELVEALAKETGRKKPSLGRIAPLVNKLEEQEYFQAVKQRVNEVNEFIQTATGQAQPELAQTLGKSEILSDLKRIGSDTLSSQEARERIENRISSIVNLDPKLQEELFAKKGVYIKAGLPFGKQKDLARIAGTEHIGPTIKLLNDKIISAGKFGAVIGKVEDTIAGAFNRNYNLPEEYIQQRDEIENYLGYAQDATVRDTNKLFKDIDKEGRKRIGSAMQEIDDATRLLEKEAGRELTQAEANKIISNNLEANKLSPQEQAVIALLYQDYKDMALGEMRAGLLAHNLTNYSPRGYNAILDEGDMTTITRGKYREAGGPNPYLSSSQERKFLTNAEAKAAGLDLEMDAAILYANRLLSSRRAVAIKQFKDSVTELFGTYQSNAKYAHTGILPTGITKQSDIPKRVIDDMRMIGETVMPSGLSESTKNILKFVDMIQRPFNRGATVYRPTFAIRQIPSNTLQAALISGVKAFKAFDPRSAIDAGLLILRRNFPLREVVLDTKKAMQDLSSSSTGMPMHIVAIRGFDSTIENPSISKGVYYAIEQSGIVSTFKSKVARELNFNNPLVLNANKETDDFFEIVKQIEQQTNKKLDPKLMTFIPHPDNQYANLRQFDAGIADHARQAGFDGIIFRSGEDTEIVDLVNQHLNRGNRHRLPESVNNFINNYFKGSDAVLAQRAVLSHIAGEERLIDFASQWSMRNPFGEKITGIEMVEEMRQNGIFRGFDASGDGFTKKLNNELDRNFSNKSVAFELGKFWKHASLIEDYNRAMLYINGRRLGHSPRESAKLVNKALFDYQRGLSNFEKQVIKRIRPFYSFQRFAIPYVLRQTLAQPGNFATIQKLVGTIEKLIVSGESLNPAEREQIPGFLLEQPNLFSGMDKDNKATFNSLNNLTPFDAINLMVFDKNGNVDYKRSAEKATLGALSPFLKIPIELWADRNIFTEKTIEEASKLGDVSQNLSRVIPQAVKDLISWEDRVDQRTGKKSTYMNPFLAYTAMNYFPVLRDYIKPLDAQTSPLGAAVNIALEQMNPIKRTKVDLKAQSEYELLRTNKEVKELLKEIQSAILIGSKSKETKAQQALADLIKTMGENQKIKQGFEIRGQGIAGKVEEGQEQSITNPAPNPTQIIK